MLEINFLDVVVVTLLLTFLARGLVRGLTREATSLVGIIGGFGLARHFQPKLQPHLESLFGSPDVAGVIAFVLILALVMLVVSLSAAALRKFMSITLTSWIDHLLGAITGLAKGVIVTSVIFFLVQGFFPDIDLVNNALATPFLNSMANYLRNFLPDAFTYNLPVRL